MTPTSRLLLCQCLQVCQRVAALVRGGPGELGPSLSSSDAAAALSVPLAIALQHLHTAEVAGVLCRDDGPEGLTFYRNFFVECETPG